MLTQLQCVCIQAQIEKALSACGFQEFFVFTCSRTDAKINSFDHPAIVEIYFNDSSPENVKSIEAAAFKQTLNAQFAKSDEEISVSSVRYIDSKFIFNNSVIKK